MRRQVTLMSAILSATLIFLLALPVSGEHQHWLDPDGAGAQVVIDGYGWSVCNNGASASTIDTAIANWESATGWQLFTRTTGCGTIDYDAKFKVNVYDVPDIPGYPPIAGTACVSLDPNDSYSVRVAANPGDPGCDDVVIDVAFTTSLFVYSHEFGHTLGLFEHYDEVDPIPCTNSPWQSTMNSEGCWPTPQSHDLSDMLTTYTPFGLNFPSGPGWEWVRPESYWIKAFWVCNTPNEKHYNLQKNSSGMSGQWNFVSLYIAKNDCDELKTSDMAFPAAGGEHCYRVKGWNPALSLHGPYGAASCVASIASGPLVRFIQNRSANNSSTYNVYNHSFSTVTIQLYDGLWWVQGDWTLLQTWTNVPPGESRQYVQPNRAPGGLASDLPPENCTT